MIDSTIRSGSYIVFLCFPFSLVPVATAILGGELLWTSVSPLVSDCGREGPLFAVLGVFAGLRLWPLVLSALLARLLWHASAAVASFGDPYGICVCGVFPGLLGWDTSYPLLLLWH